MKPVSSNMICPKNTLFQRYKVKHSLLKKGNLVDFEIVRNF